MAEVTTGYAMVGDIGGTNARLQLSHFSKDSLIPKVIKEHVYRTNDHKGGLEEILEDFLKDVDRKSETYPTYGIIAMACPIVKNEAEKFANVDWPTINGDEIAKNLEIQEIVLLNDFAARGWGILSLKEDQVTYINKGEATSFGTKLAIGPGTGLGACFATFHRDENGLALPIIHSIEAAHTEFCVHDETEKEFSEYYLKLRPKWTYFHLEHGCCGPSIPLMYNFFAEKEGKETRDDLDGKAITKLAQSKEDPIAVKAMDLFLKIFGEIASNYALNFMPFGGIYLTSGIAVNIKDLLVQEDGPFLKAYYTKGFLDSKLHQIPLCVVHVIELGLDGCENLAHRKLFGITDLISV